VKVRGAQAKADASPPVCAVCGQPLSRVVSSRSRTFQSRFGAITVRRRRGYCKRCRKWRVPADAALGLEESAGLREQLHAEALRRGLGQAASAPVIGDGAVWIWHLADDRWPQARQRLDFYHAVQPLAAVGRALFGENQEKLKAWLQPLVKQLQHQSSLKVIRQLEEALAGLPQGPAAEAVFREVNCFHEHRGRMDSRAALRAGEPIGSGPVEATCRQAQGPVQATGPVLEPGR
jgi:hypothetical protein